MIFGTNIAICQETGSEFKHKLKSEIVSHTRFRACSKSVLESSQKSKQKTRWQKVKLLGFTLAEILITLGIIGVVASITIPTLINNYQKKETSTQLQNSYSIILQAVKMSELDNGQVSSWNYGTSNDATSSDLFFNTYLTPYLSIMKDFGNSAQGCSADPYKTLAGADSNWNLDKWHYAILANGSCIALITLSTYINIDLDVNGPQRPNQLGKDKFRFDIYPATGFTPSYSTKTRAELVASGGECASDKSGNGCGCARLIMVDGWKIASDYPW